MEDIISAERDEYTKYMTDSHLVRTLLKGTPGMREAGTKYLPQDTFETDTNYDKRIERSFLFNAYQKTCSFLSGQVFQKEIEFGEEESEIHQFNNNIDMKGNDTNVFGKRIFFNGVSKGASHILVEYSGKTPKETKEEEAKAGDRPFFVEIASEDVFAWADETGKILQLRIKRQKTERDGKFGSKTINFILVLEPGIWEEYYEKDGGGYDSTPTNDGTTNLDYVPFVSFIPGEETSMVTGKPPMNDLGYLNLKHWQSSSDQDNILHVARVPLLFGKNLGDLDKLPVSVSGLINSNDEDADLKYVEIQGKAIESGRTDLEDVKAEMALYGLQQLIPRTGNLTATEKSLNSNESNSSLSTWAIEFEDFYESAYQIAADFTGKDFPEDSIEVNKEYMAGFNTEELAKILDSVDRGITSKKKAFAEFKRRNVFSDSHTWEEAQDDIEEETRNDTSFSDIGKTLLEDENDQGAGNN